MQNTHPVTFEQINELGLKAAAAGDVSTFEACIGALAGDEGAIAACAAVIAGDGDGIIGVPESWTAEANV